MRQGELEITVEAGTGKAAAPNAQGEVRDVVERVPFLMLALDLPPAPLYKDALEKNIIPQVGAILFAISHHYLLLFSDGLGCALQLCLIGTVMSLSFLLVIICNRCHIRD